MHPKLMILLFLTSLPTSICLEPILEATGSASGPRPSAANQEMYLELLHALEQLEHGEPKTKVPEKKKSIYERAWDAIAPSHEFKEGLRIIWLRWTFEIKQAVGLAECGHFSGYAGPNKEIYYQYETDDGHCDTVIEQIEVERAIERQIKKEGAAIQTTQCLDLTDTWVWNGHLLIGPAKGFDYEIECGPKLIVTPVSMMWDLETLEKAEKEKEKQADREL
ncbi:hypothetical protein FVEG_08558 [Fusarium verticillioides 7600]|uniref:Secreted protein CSS2 C-terminal domain-containing protein n=1 Tax=Gibberella moniliformis (strain M3125 / FGSC 7600) TaxID=334819 RepID=W7MMD9_GIBM7|nr:hypothetical protein FVEG_08558 [Fusarium verticillioides 7600]EWG48909.1 hypothetical protein FVEG_08558 [Fusarium verticillioides 7600]